MYNWTMGRKADSQTLTGSPKKKVRTTVLSTWQSYVTDVAQIIIILPICVCQGHSYTNLMLLKLELRQINLPIKPKSCPLHTVRSKTIGRMKTDGKVPPQHAFLFLLGYSPRQVSRTLDDIPCILLEVNLKITGYKLTLATNSSSLFTPNTSSTQQIPSIEANSCSASQNIRRVSRNTKVHRSVQKDQIMILVVGELIQSFSSHPIFYNIF
jgi:hypothetical protein